LPCSGLELLGKIFAWALLGIVIKYDFIGMKGFTQALFHHRMLPIVLEHSIIGKAFCISLFTNVLFGPQMMFFHRLEDNFILRRISFSGLTKAWWTLLWFWIPAHTLTFSLPRDYQIGLAALWSIALALIMGLTKK